MSRVFWLNCQRTSVSGYCPFLIHANEAINVLKFTFQTNFRTSWFFCGELFPVASKVRLGKEIRLQFYGAVSALQCEDHHVFDNFPGSERIDVPEFNIESKKVDVCMKCNLFPLVVRVLKTLSWDVTRQMRFPIAMEVYGFEHSLSAFRILVHVFGVAGMRREVYSLLRDVISHCKETNLDLFKLFQTFLGPSGHSRGSAVVVDELVKNFASSSMVENAVDVFLLAKSFGIQPSIKSCNFLLKCLVEARKDEFVRCLFEDMETSGPSPNAYTYGIMMNFYCNGHPPSGDDIEKATQLLEDLESSGENLSVVTYGTYIHGLCKVGLVDFSLNFIRSLRCRGKPVNSYCYNSVIYSFCQKGELSEALKVLEDMRNHGTSPDVYSYSLLVNGFCRRGNIRKGIDLIKDMLRCSIKPSLVCYTPLLQAMSKSGLLDVSVDLFHDLSSGGYDQAVYNVLINGFSLQGDLVLAQKLLLEMIKNNLVPNALSFDGLIHGLCKTSLLDEALELLGIMRRGGVSPTTFTYNVIIDAYCQMGQLEEALILLNQMHNSGTCPNSYTYNPVIDGLFERGDWKKAFALLPQMLRRNVLCDIHCSKLIDGFSKHSKPKKALIFYMRMVKLGVKPTTISYTVLINIFSQQNRMQEASYIFNDMVRKGLTPDTVSYTSLINGFCKIGDMKKAWAWYKEMIYKGCSPNLVTYTCLIDGFCNLHRMDMANSLVDEMKKNGIDPDAVAYTVLITANKRLGHFDKAHVLFEEMRKKGLLLDDVV